MRIYQSAYLETLKGKYILCDKTAHGVSRKRENVKPCAIAGLPGINGGNEEIIVQTRVRHILLLLALELCGAGTSLAQAPRIAPSGIVNSASFASAVAPGSIVSIFGANLATGEVNWAGGSNVATMLGNVSVTFAGRKAPLFYVSPSQINAQVPFEVVTGQVPVIVTVGDNSSEPVNASIVPTSPGLYQFGAGRAMVQNENGELNTTSNGAVAGSVLVAYLTGQGLLNRALATGEQAPNSPFFAPRVPVTATIGGRSAEVIFAGLSPGFVGLLQVNLRVPAVSAGDHSLVVDMGGIKSNGAFVTVKVPVSGSPISGAERAKHFAQSIANSTGYESRYATLLSLMEYLRIGVYKVTGEAIVSGAERGVLDFYLYDFEVQTLARALGAPSSVFDLDQIARSLTDMGFRSGDAPLSAAELRQDIIDATRAAAQTPDDQTSLSLLLVRELGLAKGYDTVLDEPAVSFSFDEFQRFLLLSDATLPVLEMLPVPVRVTRVSEAKHPKAASRRAESGPCVTIGTSDVKIVWSIDRLLWKWLLKRVNKTAASLAGLAGPIIDGLHGSLLALSVQVRALNSTAGPIHYSHGAPVGELKFSVLVEMLDQLPQAVIECGWLAGVAIPNKGPIPDVPILWEIPELEMHGEIACDENTCAKTGQDGVATLIFRPRQEEQPNQGSQEDATNVVNGIALIHTRFFHIPVIDIEVPIPNGNVLGLVSQLLFPKLGGTRWFVTFHRGNRQWSGSVQITQSGSKTVPAGGGGFQGVQQQNYILSRVVNVKSVFADSPRFVQLRTESSVRGSDVTHTEIQRIVLLDCGRDGTGKVTQQHRVTTTLKGTGASTESETTVIQVQPDGSYEIFVSRAAIPAKGTTLSYRLSVQEGCPLIPGNDYEETDMEELNGALISKDYTLKGKVDPRNPDVFAGSQTIHHPDLFTTSTVQWNFRRQ
jgi:uncharacterized protein (TIGR03437 family)